MKQRKPTRIRRGPKGRQIAALPVRWNADGEPEVLLVTSRTTRRWIIPKGWTMEGKKPWKAAGIEAHEEAGAKGKVRPNPIGSYEYIKILRDGSGMICDVEVFPMVVEDLIPAWKEKNERKRVWFPADRAARLVQEPQLASLLRKLKKKKMRARIEEG
ncbi:8-oxo-dGTP pyrophosphatase MutT (NUDIX family) [Aliiruegeria haliotis]|uniref:8-oxo-dGTP pyrophosphatase MutT (NUDIX family) n=1 Tax=Aliiruegeria haliotis TaxID=1280846 RepID=A0A2T0RWM9_9RHOB|nr:NUDIX hydrolase [Aliiruegeria haliotis]PRY25532.1 8-oxo-dGTP pyrophosphatase MutT (NUDIX family) [Aliiruegeria haliotis]